MVMLIIGSGSCSGILIVMVLVGRRSGLVGIHIDEVRVNCDARWCGGVDVEAVLKIIGQRAPLINVRLG